MVTALVLVHVLAAIVSAAARPRLAGALRAAAAANVALAGAAAVGGAIYVALSLRAAWTAVMAAPPDQKPAALWAALAGRLGGIAVLLAAGVVTAGGACLLYVRSRKVAPPVP
jgi:hypothetical protein